MGRLRVGHIVEAVFWLSLALVLYIYSFEFERNIEIYKFGATGWPRALILLIAIAAIGQLIHHWMAGDDATSSVIGAATDDGAEEAAHEAHHSSLRWYLSTFGLLIIPFAYMRLPEWISAALALEGTGVQAVKLGIGAVLFIIYLVWMQRNHVGAILALPIFFAAVLEDMGFYAMAPFFIVMVMILMGERRVKPMIGVTALVFGILLFLFVKVLYVGLPTGNIHPFYDFGNWVVKMLQ